MDDTRDPSENGQTDVDQEVSTTSALQEDTQRRQDDGEDDLADVTVEMVSMIEVGSATVVIERERKRDLDAEQQNTRTQ